MDADTTLRFPSGRYRCIVIDPPWAQPMVGRYAVARHSRPNALPYETMTLPEIAALPVERLAEEGAHLWLWTTNRFLRPAFDLLDGWGFTYLQTVTWVKPSGLGAWFANTTQHVLMAYYQRCIFPAARYRPTHFQATPRRHSEKPNTFYDLARAVSPGPRIELFARRGILGFEAWGDEVSTEAVSA